MHVQVLGGSPGERASRAGVADRATLEVASPAEFPGEDFAPGCVPHAKAHGAATPFNRVFKARP